MECKHEFTMCRLCLCEGESLTDIFQVNEWFGYIAAVVITDLLQLQVSGTDGYPHVVCSVCLEKLADFKQFKQQCQNSRDTYYNVFMSHDGEDEYPAYIEPSITIKTESDEGGNSFYSTTEVDLNPVHQEEDEIITDDIPPQVEHRPIKLEPIDPSDTDEDQQEVTCSLEDEESFTFKQENDSETEERSERERRELSPVEIEERGTKKKYFRCNDCGKEYGGKDSLIRHLKVNGCVVNEESGGKEKDLQINANVSGGSKSNAYEGHKIGLKRKKSDKAKKDKGIKKYVCDTCGQGFNWMSDLKRHLKIHTGEKPFACDICEKRFNKHSNLKKHELTHSSEKPFSCDICEKRFRYKQYLNEHKLTHSSEKPFSCDVCEKSFRIKSKLRKHKLTHSSEKPFACDICEKRFTNKQYLKSHKRTHAGEKPYKCEICSKNFTRNFNLINHMRIHSGESPYKCKECNKFFSHNSSLKQHLRIHSQEKPFECSVCKKCFIVRSKLIRHLKIHS